MLQLSYSIFGHIYGRCIEWVDQNTSPGSILRRYFIKIIAKSSVQKKNELKSLQLSQCFRSEIDQQNTSRMLVVEEEGVEEFMVPDTMD